MGATLSETEIQKSLDFCVRLFDPVDVQETEEEAGRQISKELLDVNAPVMNPEDIQQALHVATKDIPQDESDPQYTENLGQLLQKLNARRVVHPEYSSNNMELEPIGGRVVRLEVGNLGLVNIAA